MQSLWKTVRRFPKNPGLKLSYDPTIPPLGKYPEKTVTEKTHVPRCSLKHFIIAKTWKQPRCP